MEEHIRKILLMSIAEFRQGEGGKIEIQSSDTSFCIRDYGRGLSLKTPVNETLNAIVLLSKSCSIRTIRCGSVRTLRFENGSLVYDSGIKDNRQRLKRGMEVSFTTPNTIPSANHRQMARELCALYKGLEIVASGERFHTINGLADLFAPTLTNTLEHISSYLMAQNAVR